MPLDIDAEVLIENEASWHKSCHLQFSTSKLNKANERLARKREQAQKEHEEMRASKTRRLSSHNKEDCILCGRGGQLHEVSTFATDEKLRLMITELQDSTLLPRISGVDLMVAEAKYHLKCLTDLRNLYRRHTSRKRQESCEEDEEKIKESQAFIELVEYIETSVENDKLMFLLSELHSLLVSRPGTLGIHKTVTKTRLKTSLLENHLHLLREKQKSAWQAWELYPDVTSTFEFLANNPFHQLTVDSDHFKRIERFTVILLDKLSPLDSINKTRMELFCNYKNNRDMDKLPPTQVTRKLC